MAWPVPSMRKSVRPVWSMARLGMQTAPLVPPGMWAWVKAVPRSTSASMCGVWTSGLPSARMVSKRWSSVKKKTMLGLRSAMASSCRGPGRSRPLYPRPPRVARAALQ